MTLAIREPLYQEQPATAPIGGSVPVGSRKLGQLRQHARESGAIELTAFGNEGVHFDNQDTSNHVFDLRFTITCCQEALQSLGGLWGLTVLDLVFHRFNEATLQ